jgi:hypothetical protein
MLNEVTMERVVNPVNMRAAYLAVKANGEGRANWTGWMRRHMRKWLPSLRFALRAAFGRRSPFDRLWQRWRHPRGRINALKRLGVRGRVLGMACSGLGAWVMRQALKTKTLNHHGFIIPWDFAESCK